MGPIGRALSLGIVLFGFWLVLSGHYKPLLIVIGLLCVAGIVALSLRMKVVDKEGHPIHLGPRAIFYFPWLILEIIKSAWDVTKIIVNPSLPISPRMIHVKAGQRTALGINIFGNSITLTPGTITVGVSGNDLTVHAITQGTADGLETGEMDRRVKDFEGAA